MVIPKKICIPIHTRLRRLAVLLAVMTVFQAGAQRQKEFAAFSEDDDYRYEAGIGAGMSGYLGDANTANLYAHPGWNVEGFFRYIINPRFGLKTHLYIGGVKGNSADMTNVFPEGNTFSFSTSFYEAGEMFEFNFFNFGIGRKYQKLNRLTPYITAGLGFAISATADKAYFNMVIPFGAGLKFKINKRLNVGVEFLMKKTLGDKFDGEALADPYQIKSSFMKNTDWYSTLTFTISYEFSRRCAECHYKP